MSELEKELANIERIYVDPDFSLMLETVRKINHLLDAEPQTDTQALKLADSINRLWRENGFHGKALYVTGFMHAGGIYKPLVYESLEGATRYRNQRVISQDFFVHVDINETSLEDDSAPLIKQSILLRGTTLIADETGIEGMSSVDCAVDFRSAEVMYPDLTPARAAAWLEEYCPDIKLDIDAALLESENEIDAVMRLKELSFDVEGLKNKRIYKMTQYICHWLLSEVQFDRHYPYDVAVQGELEIFNPSKREREVISVNDVLSVHAKELSISYHKKNHELQFGLTSEVIDGPTDVSRPTQIPLSMIDAMESKRS